MDISTPPVLMAAGLLPPISCRPFGTAKLFYHKSYEWQTSDRQRHKKQQLDKSMTRGLRISPCCGAECRYFGNECPEICEIQNFRAVDQRMLSKPLQRLRTTVEVQGLIHIQESPYGLSRIVGPPRLRRGCLQLKDSAGALRAWRRSSPPPKPPRY